MYGAYTNHSMGRPAPCLLKQTYSTTSNEDGQVKYWHVVAYTNKIRTDVAGGCGSRNKRLMFQFMPGYDGPNPLPLPHQLPLLANITIEPGRYPDWEQQRDTTEAYARRPPPGTVLPTHSPTTATAPGTSTSSMHQPIAGPSQPSRIPSPSNMYTPSGAVPYASPPYGPRRSRDGRGEPMWPYQTPGYHPDDQNQSFGSMPNGQPYYPYDFSHLPPNGGGPLQNRPNELYDMPRRDRPSPPRSTYGSQYPVAPGYPPYPRVDRYPDVSPDYTARPPQIQIRTHEPVDVKPIYEDGHQDKNQLTVRLPLTPVSASSVNGELPSLGPSPKLSINNNLLNPPDGSDRATLTLPPLMRSVHEGASPVSPTGRVSPNGDALPSEDARQLDGLGRRAY
jgi:hypothetical protein